jgi:hypothetical protein
MKPGVATIEEMTSTRAPTSKSPKTWAVVPVNVAQARLEQEPAGSGRP